MNDIQKLSKILQFYVLGNKLKTTILNNYKIYT